MPDKKKSAKYDKPVSMAPLTPDQALKAALQVKPADIEKLAKAEKAQKAKRKK